jgi:hypothetical protein
LSCQVLKFQFGSVIQQLGFQGMKQHLCMKKLKLVKAMNIETKALKLELIQWILLLQDIQLLNEIQNLKESSNGIQPRQFGCGKGIFTYVADDFEATPPGFEEYLLP